jgi:tellurite methyltransferase
MDKNYWKEYYKTQNEELKPSLFAIYVRQNFANKNDSLIELGCGNGRDVIYFANEGLLVLGIDQCEDEIEFLRIRYAQLKTLSFQVGDFSNFQDGEPVDLVYSRFTLHSVSKEQEYKTLEWTYRNLKHGGYFCIEVRGQKNEIYKLGKQVENDPDAYIYDNHYRRFLNFENLQQVLKQLGFYIVFAAEEKGFAPYAEKDETYIRIIAEKQ